MSRAFILSVFSFLICCTSCATDTGGHSFRVHREDGIPVAETTGGPRYDGELFAFDPIVTLNQDEANSASLLYSISEMTMDADGNVYVVDNRSYRVAVFGPDGEYRYSFGRQGSGPGEFQYIEIVWFDGETFTLWDGTNRRMNHYRRDGTFLDSRTPPNQVRVLKMMSLADGRLLTWRRTTDAREGYAWHSMVICVHTSDGDTLATILTDEIVIGAGEERSPLPGLTEYHVTGIPFTSEPEILFDPDRGLAVNTGMTPEIRWYDLDGNPSGLYRLPLRVQRVSSDIKQAYEDNIRQRMREFAERTGRDPGPVSVPTYPEYAALWRGGFFDEAGYLWLDAVHLPGREEQPAGDRYYILDPEGRFLGYATLPGTRLMVRHGRLVSLAQDVDTGENTVTVYRIRPLVERLKYPGSGK